VLPLALYGGYAGVAALRKRLPPRHVLNVHTSLLLMVYLLVTASLGIFWVANQQLPVFDLHYLFGYGTLLLVAVHLSFNLPVVVRTLRKRAAKRRGDSSGAGDSKSAAGSKRAAGSKSDGGSKPAERSPRVLPALFVFAALVLAFFLGMRHGRSELVLPWGEGHNADTTGLDLGPVGAVIRYHEFSSHSRRGVFERAPSVDWGAKPEPFKHLAGETVELSRRWPGSRPLSDALHTVAAPGEPLSRDRLGAILFHAAGVTATRGGYKLRAAPTSGGLAPTELYVASVSVSDLPDGVYHYDAEHHRLVRLEPQGDPTGATATTVYLTSIFRRTGHKYRDRAYRYALADAGHMLENLRIAAAEAGYAATPLARFDDGAVAASLNVDGVREGVVAAVPLLDAPRRSPHVAWHFAEPPTDTAIGVTGVVHHATSLRAESRSGMALPEPLRADRPVLTVMRQRRSQRRFDRDQAVSLEQLSAVLAASRGPGTLLSRSITLFFVANRVRELEPGVYRYAPGHNTITRMRAGEFSEAAHGAALSQDVIGDAAVVFVLTADRTTLFADHGVRGYRHAFLEAGMVGERLLLTASALGLSACPVGAFYDDEAAALLGVDPNDQWVLHFAGLGNP